MNLKLQIRVIISWCISATKDISVGMESMYLSGQGKAAVGMVQLHKDNLVYLDDTHNSSGRPTTTEGLVSVDTWNIPVYKGLPILNNDSIT